LSAFLFIVVFGLSLGGRIKKIDGFDYDAFIVPGLLTMAMAQAAYTNNASSIFQARFDHYLNDLLAAPMRSWEVNLGFSLGGVIYSVQRLGAPWVQVSHANPLFYLVNAVRYGFLGHSDVSVVLSLGVVAALAAAAVGWSSYLFATGRRIKP